MHYQTGCGHLLKILFWDGQGLVLYAKRLERGRFVWPQAKDGVVSLTPAQLSMLTEGIDWRCLRAPGSRRWLANIFVCPRDFLWSDAKGGQISGYA